MYSIKLPHSVRDLDNQSRKKLIMLVYIEKTSSNDSLETKIKITEKRGWLDESFRHKKTRLDRRAEKFIVTLPQVTKMEL